MEGWGGSQYGEGGAGVIGGTDCGRGGGEATTGSRLGCGGGWLGAAVSNLLKNKFNLLALSRPPSVALAPDGLY